MDLQLALNYSTEGMNHHHSRRQILCEKTSREAFRRRGPHTECGTECVIISEDSSSSPLFTFPQVNPLFPAHFSPDSSMTLRSTSSRCRCCRPAPPPTSPEAAHGKVHPRLPRAPLALHHLQFSCLCYSSLLERGGHSWQPSFPKGVDLHRARVNWAFRKPTLTTDM